MSGLREGILDKLTQVRGLRVVSRSSSTRVGSHPADLRELSRRLGADRLLTGSVGKSTDRLSLDVRLIDPQTGAQIWEQTYTEALTGVSGVDGAVAQKVADALKIRMAADERHNLRTAATSNPRARDLYLRARALGKQSDEKSRTQQLNLLREAVAEDPNYAQAWAELSGVYLHLADAYRAPREILTPARDAAVKAVALDENLAFGHLILGGIAMSYDWDFPLAKREIERAIALDPNSSVAHRLYGWLLARTERNYIAARQEVAKARSLEPLDPWPFWSESNIAIAQGDYESAMRMAQRVIEMNPQFLYDEDPIAHVHVAAGRWQDALKRYESIPASRFNRPNFELAICYARTGQVARARHILQELRALAQQRYVDHTHIAAIHAALGEKDEAFAALEQACKDRSARVYAPRFYPWLSPLRDDPRFLELEERIANSRLPSSNARLALPDPSVALFPSRL